MAEDFIAKNGAKASSSEITEYITGVKLPRTVAAAKMFRKCVGMASVSRRVRCFG